MLEWVLRLLYLYEPPNTTRPMVIQHNTYQASVASALGRMLLYTHRLERNTDTVDSDYNEPTGAKNEVAGSSDIDLLPRFDDFRPLRHPSIYTPT